MKYRIIKHGMHAVNYTVTYEEAGGVWTELFYSDVGGVTEHPAMFGSVAEAREPFHEYIERRKKKEEDRNTHVIVEEGEL